MNMKLKHDSFISVHVMRLACAMVACLMAVGASAQTTYTWTGANTDGDAGTIGDWSFAGNWDGNGVPTDSDANAGLSFANVGSKIVFSTTTLPSSSIPNIGGTAAGGKESPIIELLSGGTLSLTAGVGTYNGFFSNSGGGRTLLVVGDGVGGGTDDVTLNVDLTGDLNRHNQAYHDFTIKSDGTLNFTKTSVQGGANKTSRNVTFTIAGGVVNFSGSLSNFGSSRPSSYADLTADGSTFTAKFGYDFVDIDAVEAEMGDGKTFRSTTALWLNVDVNGDFFTVSSMTPVAGAITVEVQDADAAEEGTDPGTIRISRDEETAGDLEVLYTLTGTADSDDYAETHTGTCTIPNGSSYVDLVFTPVDDAVYVGDRSIVLTVDTDAAYVVGLPSSGTITITDNDGITVAVPDAVVAEEGSEPGTIRISRGSDNSGALDVYYTIDGTADGSDYSASDTSPATIADGNTFVDLVFTPVDDSALEGSQTIVLTVTADAAYGLVSPISGTITIADNEESPISSVAAGNWTNASTWSSMVPEADRRASIKHDVTIDSDVGKVDKLLGDGNGSLTMNGGTLDVDDGDYTSIPVVSLTNGSTLDFNQFARPNGTWTVDGSSLSFGTDAANWKMVEMRYTWDCTLRNGSTFWTPYMSVSGNVTQNITVEGSGNTLNGGYNSNGSGTGATNFKFVMDDTDAALSTWSFGALDLGLGTRSWNLVVDATEWNGVNGRFTLFDADTLTGTFDSVQFIGISPQDEVITYDYVNGDITLDITPPGMVFVVK
ncbi:MAG: hypothetical protein HN341_18505, partial [Verrucomicrobia bacterium]|nr:hypothetical protein [Verrucomicrobiota bacterium]